MAIPIDLVLHVLGLDSLNQLSTASSRSAASVSADAKKMGAEYFKVESSLKRLKEEMKKQSGNLALEAAYKSTLKVKNELIKTRVQALQLNKALQDIKSKDVTVRIKAANTIADIRQQKQGETAALQGALGGARSVGLGMVAAGGAGALGLGNAAQAAGQWQMWETAFTKLEGSADAAKKKLEELNQFAMKTPFSMPGIVQNAQMLKAMGFQSNELLPALHALGDATAATGQGEDVFNRLALNLGQMRSMEHPMQRDLNQFAYAGINVKDVISKQMGKDVSMDDIKQMGGKEFVDTFLKGLEKQFGGTLEAQAATLPGALNNMSDAFFRLKVAIGGPLIPAITAVSKMLSGFANWFASAPGWLQTTISWAAALTVGVVTLAGAFLAAAAQVGLAKLALGEEGFAGAVGSLLTPLKAVGGGVGTLIESLGGLGSVLTVALPLAVAVGAGLLIKAWNDKMAEADDARAENKDNPVNEQATQGITPGTKAYDEAQLAELDARRRKAEEISKESTADTLLGFLNKDIAGTDGNMRQRRRVEDAKIEAKSLKIVEDNLRKDIARKQYAAPVPTNNGAAPAVATPDAALPGIGGADSSGVGASTVSLQPQIRALQDKIRATKDKTEKADLRNQLVQLQRAEQDRKAALAAEKKSDAAAKKLEAAHQKTLRIEGGVLDDRMESQLRIAKAREEAAATLGEGAGESAMNAQIDALNTRAELGLADKDATEKQIAQLKAAHEKEAKDAEAAHKIKLAAIEAESTLAQARAEAMGKSVEEQKAVMAKAQIKANEITTIAGIEADTLRKQGAQAVADAAAKKTKRETLMAFLRGGGAIGSIGAAGRSLVGSAGVAIGQALGAGGAMFNPYANASYAGTSGAFSTTIGANLQPLSSFGASVGSRNLIPLKSATEGNDFIEYRFEPIRVKKNGLQRAGRMFR